MIRIQRPAFAPAILLSRGAAERTANCAAFDANPAGFVAGTEKFDIKASIYGHADIKASLKSAQHDKCAFCEAKVSHVAYGDIEHFRPKAGWQQTPDQELQRPGYYWLAYEWTNLLFACQLCNQQGKKNFFPLSRPASRARSHHDDHLRERPLLVDPASENPGEFIGFREEVAFHRPRSRKGKATIELLGLNRPALLERRRDYFMKVKLLADVRKAVTIELSRGGNTAGRTNLEQKLTEIDIFLATAKQPQSEYSAMVNSNL
jgi:uncharacterized protein (TIGR02646 family)